MRKIIITAVLFIQVGIAAVSGHDQSDLAFRVSVAFAKNGWEKNSEPGAVTYGNGYIFIRADWKPVPAEQGIVQYRVWVRNLKTDWESASSLKIKDPTGTMAWTQDLYIPKTKANKNTGVRAKLSFGYRPGIYGLPEIMPLNPGVYKFELCAQRIFEDGRTDLYQHPFEITVKPAPADLLISGGIADFQVFQRKNQTTGDIDLAVINDGSRFDYKVAVKSGNTEIAETSGSSTSGVCQIKIQDIPVGGPYTVEIRAGQKNKTVKDIYVGDLWIVSGQSNAVGCGYDTSFGKKPMGGVHCLNPAYDRWIWGVAKDGFFGPYVGPWVTAAQEYYKQTGVPVGLMGHAVGGQAMDYFMDDTHKEMPFLKEKIKRNGANASLFMWYQGESDTFDKKAMESYREKLTSMAEAMRSYTSNPNLKIGIVQLGKYLWFKDDHFAEMREIQRQFVLNNKNSVLFSTISYEVNNKDKIHLTSPGQVALGNQIARSMIRYEQTGVLTGAPDIRSAKFINKERTVIRVEFENGEGLTGSAVNEWFVKDKAHMGFKQGGFVNISKMDVFPEKGTVILELTDPVSADATLSYAYQCNTGGTLVNSNGTPAAAFVDYEIQ